MEVLIIHESLCHLLSLQAESKESIPRDRQVVPKPIRILGRGRGDGGAGPYCHGVWRAAGVHRGARMGLVAAVPGGWVCSFLEPTPRAFKISSSCTAPVEMTDGPRCACVTAMISLSRCVTGTGACRPFFAGLPAPGDGSPVCFTLGSPTETSPALGDTYSALGYAHDIHHLVYWDYPLFAMRKPSLRG